MSTSKTLLRLEGPPETMERCVGQILINCIEYVDMDGIVVGRQAGVALTGEGFEEGKTVPGLREAYAWTALAANILVNSLAEVSENPAEDTPRIIRASSLPVN